MKRKILFAIAAVLLTACHKDPSTTSSLFKDDGHRKSAVALVPVMDKSDSDLPWDLSEEFTQAIKSKLLSRGNVLISDEYNVLQTLSNVDERSQPFGPDMDWISAAFKDEEFVIFLEIVDHYLHTHPNPRLAQQDDHRSSFLDLTMRLRVIDVRGDTPKVALQELIHHEHNIPKLFADIDYSDKRWGTTTFNFTPLGLAHSQLIREVTTRLEDYISIAHSR